MIAVIDAGGYVIIIAAIGLVITQVLTLTLQYLAGRKVDAVRDDLALNTEVTEINSGKVSALTEVSHQTHTLVNSNMGVQLALNAVLAQRIAVITKDPEDVKAAELAERYLKEHLEKQRIADNQRK